MIKLVLEELRIWLTGIILVMKERLLWDGFGKLSKEYL